MPDSLLTTFRARLRREAGPGLWSEIERAANARIDVSGRLRERLFYPPRQGSYELRDVVREQIYHLTRVIRGDEETYTAFVPG